MNKTIGIIVLSILFVGCKNHIPLFENNGTNMNSWSAGDKGTGGTTFTLLHLYNDTTQRHYFVSYTTITNFIDKTFDYHISSISFHKDSVNLKKLNRITKQNSGEYLLVKRNKKGNYLIKSEWYEEKNHTVKIKSGEKKRDFLNKKALELNSTALKMSHFVIGEMISETNKNKRQYENILMSYYANDILIKKNDLSYFEYVFEFDSISYVFNGYADKMLNIDSKNLFEVAGGVVKRYSDSSFKAEIIKDKILKIATLNKPIGITIAIGKNLVLSSDFTSINQTIRAMKWGAWVGFSPCEIKSNDGLIVVGQKIVKTGVLKSIVL